MYYTANCKFTVNTDNQEPFANLLPGTFFTRNVVDRLVLNEIFLKIDAISYVNLLDSSSSDYELIDPSETVLIVLPCPSSQNRSVASVIAQKARIKEWRDLYYSKHENI